MGLPTIFHLCYKITKSFSFHRVPQCFTFTFVYIRIVLMFSLYLLCFVCIFETNFTNKIVYMLDNNNVTNK